MHSQNKDEQKITSIGGMQITSGLLNQQQQITVARCQRRRHSPAARAPQPSWELSMSYQPDYHGGILKASVVMRIRREVHAISHM